MASRAKCFVSWYHFVRRLLLQLFSKGRKKVGARTFPLKSSKPEPVVYKLELIFQVAKFVNSPYHPLNKFVVKLYHLGLLFTLRFFLASSFIGSWLTTNHPPCNLSRSHFSHDKSLEITFREFSIVSHLLCDIVLKKLNWLVIAHKCYTLLLGYL